MPQGVRLWCYVSITIVNEVASVSDEQARGFGQINLAISQMSQATQSNAANAEEAASASEEVAGQSETVRDQVAELMHLVKGNGR